MDSKMKNFLMKFNFNKKLNGCIGVERERFLTDVKGIIVPKAKEFLEKANNPNWTYELSACQIEDRTKPRSITAAICYELLRNDWFGEKIAGSLGLKIVSAPVGPENMPLDVYPNPRYHQIAKSISDEQLRAACQAAGVHIHIGMADMQLAIKSYNILREQLDFYCGMGDNSFGERLRIYKIMAQNWNPPAIESAEHFYELSLQQGFSEDPRKCYWLIRISPHGTVEMRMFDASSIREIMLYIKEIRRINA